MLQHIYTFNKNEPCVNAGQIDIYIQPYVHVKRMKDDIATKIKTGRLRLFGHTERMNEKRLTKEMYTEPAWN